MQDDNSSSLVNALGKAGTLIEALPFMRRYSGRSIVVKFGGYAMGEKAFVDSFAADIVLLRQVGAKPVVVHGAARKLARCWSGCRSNPALWMACESPMRQPSQWWRWCWQAASTKALVAAIDAAGAMAVGLSGKDARLITADRLAGVQSKSGGMVDLGFVGTPAEINPAVIGALIGLI